MTTNANAKYYLAIFFVCFLVNWPIFFSDVLVNDDLTLVTSNLIEDYDGLKRAYYALAKPSGYIFYRAMAAVTPDGVFPYRVYNFVLIALCAMVFFAIISRAWDLNKETALVMTVGFLCFPSTGIQPFAIGTIHFVSYLTFLTGVLMVHRFWSKSCGIAGLVVGCISLAMGARMSSTIPFLYVFLFSFLWIELHKRWENPGQEQHNLVTAFWLALLMTVIVIFTFTIEWQFYQQHRFFGGGYNKVKLDQVFLLDGLKKGLDGLKKSIELTYFGRFTILFDWSKQRLLLLVLVTTGLLLVYGRKANFKKLERGTSSPEKNNARYIFLALMIVVAVFMAVFPYVAVGKIPKPEGYQSRWAILTGVGGALTIGLIYELAQGARYRLLQWLGYALTLFLCCSFTLETWDSYGKWQRVSFDNQVMIAKLQALEFRPEIHVYCVNTNIHSEQFYVRRWYDWAYVFDQSWHTNREVMGFDKSYCEKHDMYQDGQLKATLPLHGIVELDYFTMESSASWMYHGKAREQYAMGGVDIMAMDTRIDKLSGATLLLEFLKANFFGSELLQSYYDNLVVSYR